MSWLVGKPLGHQSNLHPKEALVEELMQAPPSEHLRLFRELHPHDVEFSDLILSKLHNCIIQILSEKPPQEVLANVVVSILRAILVDSRQGCMVLLQDSAFFTSLFSHLLPVTS